MSLRAIQTVGRISRSAGQSLSDLIFPPRCLLCGDAPRDSEPFCRACGDLLRREREATSCPKCAASVARYEVRDGRCSDCRGRLPKVSQLVRVGPYGKLLGYMLRRYKYNDRGQFGPILGNWLAERLGNAEWIGRVEAVTSVPSHWTRRLRKPAHPADELAAVVARRLDLPFLRLLRRVRSGPHQVGLTYNQRLSNVLGLFRMRAGVQLNGATILIIDDVRTTGATLNECGKVLRRAGAKEVYGGVVVRARPDRSAGSRILGPV